MSGLGENRVVRGLDKVFHRRRRDKSPAQAKLERGTLRSFGLGVICLRLNSGKGYPSCSRRRVFGTFRLRLQCKTCRISLISISQLFPSTQVCLIRMLDDGITSEPIFAALNHGYHFRLIGPNVEEMIATTQPARREKLFQVCGRLVHQGDSDTIYPHQELLKRLIVSHAQDSANFIWQNVNMLSADYENGIGDWALIRDKDLSAEQRESARLANAAFDPIWKKLKPNSRKRFCAEAKSRLEPSARQLAAL